MVRIQCRPVRVGAGVSLGLMLLSLNSGPVRAEGPPAIPWREDLSRALAEAKAQDRPVWMQFTGPWCHFCVRMERETFQDLQIAGHARDRFVPVKLRSDVHEALALEYGLSGLPATVLLKPNGEVIAARQGFADAGAFRAFLEEALKRDGRPFRSPPEPAPRPGDGLALAGYCPVSLVADHRLVPGRSEVTIAYQGRVYRFANALGLRLFQKQPERFIPVNSGDCPVAQVDRGESCAGDPRWGALYEGHLYLCADDASRKRFLRNPERYAHVDVADRGFCPHCWGKEKLVVRGRSPFSLSRAGRRYLFPDIGHLEAFRASTETARR